MTKLSRLLDHLLVPIYSLDQIGCAPSRQLQIEHRDWWRERRPRVVELWDRGGRR